MTLYEPLYGLTGTLWPVHLKPQPDELLSSWIIRLAHAHGYKVQTMCAILFGRNSAIWNRDIDRIAPQKVLEILANISGTKIEVLENATLKSYEGVLFERHNANGACRWIVPLGIFNRSRRRLGLLFCPQCLEDDTYPYFRKHWRLAFSTICTKHNCYLLDACPKCQSPIAPHRSDMQGQLVFNYSKLNAHCWKCNFDLRMSPQIKVLDNLLVSTQAQLEAALANGYTAWANNSSMHSIVFFEGLRQLITGLTSKQTQERLMKSVTLDTTYFNDRTHAALEMTPLSTRRKLFHLLAIVLEDWPTNFARLIHECNLRYSDLKGYGVQRAAWYESIIRLEANSKNILISYEEANAIANIVDAKRGRFSGRMAKALSGHDINSHVPERLLQPVSDEVYEAFMTNIDHQISDTQDKVERICLIRNKVMFAAGRQLRLSEGKLAYLTLEQVRALAPDVVKLNFYDIPQTPAQARAWVEWYWKKIRANLHPREDIFYIFTSTSTGRNFHHSAIGSIFNKLIDTSMLRDSIRSYDCWIKNTT